MVPPIIRADYPVLEQVAAKFDGEHERIMRIKQVIDHQLHLLRRGGWDTEAATAFYREMDNDVLPAVMRLAKALDQGAQTSREIIRLLKAAEEDAAAQLYYGDMHLPPTHLSSDIFGGGGDGAGLTRNDEFSDDVVNVTTDSEQDQVALTHLAAIEEEFNVAIAFPTDEQNDMPQLPDGEIPDPAKPQLRTVTGDDTETLVTVEQQLRELKEYGVELTQTENAHWTPEEINQLHAAVTGMGEHAYKRAIALGLIQAEDVTPAQAFTAVYTVGENGLVFERSADNRHGGSADGAYAWNSNGKITMYDAAYYGQQTTGTGAQRGVYFSPYLLIQHEISHQLNYKYTIDGQSLATVYSESFPYVEGQGYAYTFQEDYRFAYRDSNGTLQVGSVNTGDTVYLPTADSGYEYRVRTVVPGDDQYNAAEAVTDALVGETAPYGAYSFAGINSYQDEVFGRARQEVNRQIFDAILTQINWGK